MTPSDPFLRSGEEDLDDTAAAMAMYCGTTPSPMDPFFMRWRSVETTSPVPASFTSTSKVQ
jgi:hypothetical protein